MKKKLYDRHKNLGSVGEPQTQLLFWPNIILLFLHLHEIVEGLYFYCSLSVCLSVCDSKCPALLVNKIPAERMHLFGHGFRKMVANNTGSDPIEIGELGSKVKDTVTLYPFFHNSLLTSLLYISALLYMIKLKFGIPLTYALCRFVCEFH